LKLIKEAGKKVGVLTKDTATGPFADEWKKSYSEISKEVEEVDVAASISNAALSVKDEKELRLLRDASRASCGVMKDYLVEEIMQIVDENKKISNRALAEKVSNKIDDPKFFQKMKALKNFDPMNIDWGQPPVVQSGGNYDLRFASESEDTNLHPGIIVAALGLKYQTYSSMVARTYLVDPNDSQERNYKILLQVHEVALKAARDGALAKDVYHKAMGQLKAKKPDLESHFVKSVGFGIGIENRDGTLLLSAKNSRPLKDGMTLVISTGLNNLENPKAESKRGKIYSLAISDTIRVPARDAESVVFTKDAPTDLENVAFFFNDSEESEVEKKPKPKKDSRIGAVAQTNLTKTRLRNERATNQNTEKEEARRQHQKEIHAKKQAEGLERYAEGTGNLNGTEEKKFKRFESYKRDAQLPTRVKDLIIVVDTKAATVVLPINGRPVPFHINTIKNASHTPEGDFTSLRINFLSPGQGVGRKDDQPFEDPNAHFIRSLTFRSKDIARMDEIVKQITDVKKEVVRKEQEKKQLEDVIEQEKLITLKSRKPYSLDMIFMRPALDSKRVPGTISIQQNGLRYTHGAHASGGSTVDVLFSNVKHLFFQPSAHEMIVLIHVHLENPIMVGKKKTKDVQFYREATEMAFDETGNRRRKHRYGDEEEFEAEQEERRRRAQLDREFKSFAEKISDAGKSDGLGVDIPFRELGFSGVYSRSSVLIQPTTDCLVQLTEPPFLALTLSEIEVVHLERVQVSNSMVGTLHAVAN
jgi:nucleosome binding factor SPN SPT16 subunit